MKNFIFKGIISVGFVGYSPVIPGTLGTIAAVFIYLLLFAFIEIPFKEYIISGVGAVIFILISLLLGRWAENYYHKKDSQKFVLDEVSGYSLAIFMIDISQAPFKIIISSFIIFRLFDIIKPFPAKKGEKLPGGLGIVMDDLIAGIYTNIVVRLLMIMPWFINLDPAEYIL